MPLDKLYICYDGKVYDILIAPHREGVRKSYSDLGIDIDHSYFSKGNAEHYINVYPSSMP